MSEIFTKKQVLEIERLIRLQKVKDEVSHPYLFTFENTAKMWNQNNAYCFARLAELAYEKREIIENRIFAFDYKNITQFEYFDLHNTDTQFFILITKKDIIISFRGTSNISDWKNNFKFNKIDFNKFGSGRVHKGFYDAFLESWSIVNEIIEEHADKKIWITGHSLGGAIATLTFASIISKYPAREERNRKIGGLYTYGQPKVGDKTFINQFKGVLNKVARVVYCNDPVPIVPFLFYKHVGASKKISRKGGFRFLRNNFAYKIEQGIDLAMFSAKVIFFYLFARAKFSNSLLTYIERHDMEKYINSFNIKTMNSD